MSQEEALKELGAQLRAEPPAGLAKLTPEQLQHLAGSIRDARHRQAAELAAAGEQAFKHIPKLLRVPIRRLLG